MIEIDRKEAHQKIPDSAIEHSSTEIHDSHTIGVGTVQIELADALTCYAS